MIWSSDAASGRGLKHSLRLRSRFALASFVAGALVVAGCSTSAEQKRQQAPPAPLVETIVVHPGSADIYSEFPAQTYARNQVEVRGRVDGYIEQWLFKPGQQVTAGQALYRLDLRPYRAQLQQAQGNLEQARADLTNAQNQTSLLQAEANLASARATLVRAQQDYERLKPLVEQDAAARQDLDAAVAGLRSAEAAVRANEAAVSQAKLNTETQISSAKGKVATQTGALQTASLNVEYGTITAPISGLIGDSVLPIGGLVTANSAQPLTTIVPLDPVWVRFKVSEAQYLAYRKRTGSSEVPVEPLILLLADGSRFPHAGKIENTLNQVDPRTGTLEVQARFPNPERSVLPGQFGRVRISTEHREGVILIPQRAVQQNQSLLTVFVVGPGNRIQARAVTTGARVGDDWIIDQGLKDGDQVVVEGLLTVRPGVVVQTTPFRNNKPSAGASQSNPGQRK